MRIVLAAAAALALSCATPASAESLKLSAVKCGDFLKSGKENIGIVLVWLQGYYSGDDDEAIIDFDKLGKNGEKIGKFCAENPDQSVAAAAEKVMEEE